MAIVQRAVGKGVAEVAEGGGGRVGAGVGQLGNQGRRQAAGGGVVVRAAGGGVEVAQRMDSAGGQQVLQAGQRVSEHVVAGARRGRDRLARHLLLEPRLTPLGPQQREAFFHGGNAVRPYCAVAVGPLQVARLAGHPVGGERQVQEAHVLGQLEGQARIVADHLRADGEGTEAAALVVEPVRHLGAPVADVLGGIQQ